MEERQSSKGGHILTRDDSSKGGRNGKRGPSIKGRWAEILESPELPESIKKALEGATININGESVKFPLNHIGEKPIDYFAFVGLTAALLGDNRYYKQIQESLDGKATEHIEHDVNNFTVTIHKASDKPKDES